MIFNMTGGGNPLNFKVVGSTTQPTDPKENMIWVNTSTAITDWVFSATQPSAKSGRVWISTGTSSPVEFNALKKNGIQVYPISAKQYVSGSWVDKEAKSYQGGKWVEWNTFITELIGKFTAVGEPDKASIQVDNNDIIVTSTGYGPNAQGLATFYSSNKIDVTEYSTLSFDVTDLVNSNVDYLAVGFFSDNTQSNPWYAGRVAVKHWNMETMIDGNYTVDLSAISGKHYFGVSITGYVSGNTTLKYKISDAKLVR